MMAQAFSAAGPGQTPKEEDDDETTTVTMIIMDEHAPAPASPGAATLDQSSPLVLADDLEHLLAEFEAETTPSAESPSWAAAPSPRPGPSSLQTGVAESAISREDESHAEGRPTTGKRQWAGLHREPARDANETEEESTTRKGPTSLWEKCRHCRKMVFQEKRSIKQHWNKYHETADLEPDNQPDPLYLPGSLPSLSSLKPDQPRGIKFLDTLPASADPGSRGRKRKTPQQLKKVKNQPKKKAKKQLKKVWRNTQVYNKCKYECGQCLDQFNSYAALTSHTVIKHRTTVKHLRKTFGYRRTEVKYFQCRLCTYRVYYDKSFIKQHFTWRHNNISLTLYRKTFLEGVPLDDDETSAAMPDIDDPEAEELLEEKDPTIMGTDAVGLKSQACKFLQCQLCPERVLKEHIYLERHFSIRHAMSLAQYRDKFSDWKQEAPVHTKTPIPEWCDQCRYRCAICNLIFPAYMKFFSHIKKSHSMSKDRYTEKHGSSREITKHHTCRLCDASVINDSTHIRSHLKNVHHMMIHQYAEQYCADIGETTVPAGERDETSKRIRKVKKRRKRDSGNEGSLKGFATLNELNAGKQKTPPLTRAPESREDCKPSVIKQVSRISPSGLDEYFGSVEQPEGFPSTGQNNEQDRQQESQSEYFSLF